MGLENDRLVVRWSNASLFSAGVDNKKVGVDNEKALELDNRIISSGFTLISI